MGTISKVGLQIWSFFYCWVTFWAPTPHKNILKWNKTVGNSKVDVWKEKYDISFKDRSIFFKVMIFFTPWSELFPVAWTMAYAHADIQNPIAAYM